MKFPKEFLLGASTAAHQVEGNNRYSDLWAQEQMEHSSFAEPSNDAVDHYHRYEEDIALLAGAGLNAYRFSIEWARVEPQEGCFDESELEHYRKVIRCCREHGVEPVVTLHHFSSPKWLIERGAGRPRARLTISSAMPSRLWRLSAMSCTISAPSTRPIWACRLLPSRSAT